MAVFSCFYCSFRYLYPKPFKIFSLSSNLILFVHFLEPSFFQVRVKGEQKISKSLPLLPHTLPFFNVFFPPLHEEARGLYLSILLPALSQPNSFFTSISYVLAAKSSKIYSKSSQGPECTYILNLHIYTYSIHCRRPVSHTSSLI